jgi:fermentation-respiration switch protein FrsA (DUF1100 family)
MIMKRIRKVITRLILTLVALYVIIVSFLYFFQDKLIFQPRHLPLSHIYQFDYPSEEFFITTPDGIKLNALLFKSVSPTKGLILYFHGNRDNLQRWGQYAIDLTTEGYDVLMADYRGYGKSEGIPGEFQLYLDARTLWQWAIHELPHDRYILYGRSLGSAVASHLAQETQPELLILETPFDQLTGSTYALFRPLLNIFPARHHFPNNQHIPQINGKIVILQGTHDWVVPLSTAVTLKPLLKTGDEFIIIEGGGHNNLRDFREYHEALTRILH